MSNRNDEAAFPCGPQTTYQYPGQPGISLNDWFMGMALQGLLEPDDVPYMDGTPHRLKEVVSVARQIADAAMEAREAKQ